MSKGRFTLLSLFGAVTFAAVAGASIAKPSYLWVGIVWTLTTAILGGATLGCFFANGRSRGLCAGFALFGWAHMVLALAPWFDHHTGEVLLTRQVVDYIGVKAGHNVYDYQIMPGIWEALELAQSGTDAHTYLSFVIISQSLMTLVVALLGGLVGRYLARQRPDERAESA
jgi:hypothetical protein